MAMSRQPDENYLRSSGVIFNVHFSHLEQGADGTAALNNRIEGSAATLGPQIRLPSGFDLSTFASQSGGDDTDTILTPRLHERGDSLPDVRFLQATETSTTRETIQAKALNSPVAPTEDDSDCLIMTSTSLNDEVWQDSKGTIRYLNGYHPRYDRISDAGGFFSGRLIQVSEQVDDQSITGSAMIVLTVSMHGYPQCLMLCRHHGQEGDDEEKNFWEAHSAVYPSTRKQEDRRRAYKKNKINPPIAVRMYKSSEVELAEDCFVNYQHTWSLRNNIVKVAAIGKVEGEDLVQLKENYLRAQAQLYLESPQ